MSTSNKLPTIAERHFALLCGEADGVTCNSSSDEDNAGWDYVLHFPPDSADTRPLDEQSGGQTVFVQIKSTASEPFRVTLKLSNALRMTQEKHPYFLVLVVEGEHGRRFLVRHFWSAEIEQTLKRVREAESAGYRNRLHRKTLTVLMSEDDDHTADIVKWMQRTFRSIGPDYQAAKTAIVQTVGYDGNGVQVSVSVKGSAAEIIDWQLGLAPTVHVSNFSAVRERFGIPLPEKSLMEKGTEISLSVNGVDCFVTLTLKQSGTTVRLPGKVYVAKTPGIPGEPVSWRVDLNFLTLLQRRAEQSCSMELNFIERVPMARLKQQTTVASWTGKGAVSATFFLNGQRQQLGDLSLHGEIYGKDWQEIDLCLGTLLAVMELHPGSETGLSLGELIDAGVWLKRFHAFLRGSISIQYTPIDDDDPAHATIFYLRCNVGLWSFIAIARQTVSADTIKDGRRTINLEPAVLLETFVSRGRWQDRIDHIQLAYQRHVEDMGDPTYFWDLGDFEEWISKVTDPSVA